MTDVALDAERHSRLLNITLNWLNARRTEVGLAPLTELAITDRVVIDNLPSELEPEMVSEGDQRLLAVTHDAIRVRCQVPPIIAECEEYIRIVGER